MAHKTNFKGADFLKRELFDAAQNLFDQYNNFDQTLTGQLVPIKSEGYHFLSQLLKPPYSSKTKETLCKLLYSNVYNAELLSCGAGEIVFITVIYLLKEYIQYGIQIPTETELKHFVEGALGKIHTLIGDSTKPATVENLLKLINKISEDDEDLASAVYEALNLAGLEGKIFIENGKHSSYLVELKEGYTFNLKPYKFFLNTGKWEERHCKVLVVDGFIENVSEIDQLLMASHDKKQPMALISQGFSEEVVATLYTNFQKKKLNVIPLRLMADVNNLNVINDVGIVCGMDPISSLKGELLTFVKFDSLPVVQKLLVTEKTTAIENSGTRGEVFSQIKQLLNKREQNRLVEDVQNILDNRIKSLSPNSVVIYLPEMSSIKNDAYRVKIDIILRHCKVILNHGVMNEYDFISRLTQDKILGGSKGYSTIPTIISNKFEKDYFESLENILYFAKGLQLPNMSSLCFYVGLTIGTRIAFMLLSSAGVIQKEND